MKRVITNRVKVEYAPGKFAEEHVFQIAGDEMSNATEITFKVFDVQNKLIKRDPGDPMKVLAESVYFDAVKKGVTIPDSTGGNACGRTFPSWEDRKFTKADQQTQSKIANYYTYLFGEVTFPGQAPVLANFRMPASVVKEWYNFQPNTLGREKDKWPTYLLTLKVSAQQEKSQFAAVKFSLKDMNLAVEDANTVLEQINKHVQEHNEQIINKQKAA